MPTVQVSVLRRLAFSLAIGLILSLPLDAQHTFGFNGPTIHGVPPSVTSFGFGGTPGPHGVPPSVTSLGFGDSRFRFHPGCCFQHRHPGLISPFFGATYYVPYVPYPYMPYAYPYDVTDPGIDDSMEEDYRGGPTIFDRRGQGQRDYVRPERQDQGPAADAAPSESATKAKAADETPQPVYVTPQPVPDQPNTVLVFRDGHELEVTNYAIVGSTLYDLSGGRTRKVALAELDLAATVKQNDQHGVEFQLPNGVKLN